MFGLSYPEAQIETWMSYDAEIQKISPGKAGHECVQDTDQERPIIQLEMSDDYVPILARKRQGIIAIGMQSQVQVGNSDLEGCQ